MNEDKEIRELLYKIMNSPALNGGFQKLEYKFDLISEDLRELKSDFKIHSTITQGQFEIQEADIHKIKQDISEIKDSLTPIKQHVEEVQDIGGGPHLVTLRDSVRSFDWTKKLLLGVLGSGVTAAIYAIYQLIS